MKKEDLEIEAIMKNSQIDGFCETSKKIVEQFIRECRERRLLPSYDFFAWWMDVNFG
jgi:hypothetical protein